MTKSKSRQRRATSNIFAMLDQSQIQEFKEAFNIIDQNRDGYIDSEDLREMLESLGEILNYNWNYNMNYKCTKVYFKVIIIFSFNF